MRQAYHYVRTCVADNFDRAMLHFETFVERKTEFENDREYFRLARDYWASQGEIFNMHEDELWIILDWRLDWDLRKKINRDALAKHKKPARFPLQGDMYEIWINLDENKERYQKMANRFR